MPRVYPRLFGMHLATLFPQEAERAKMGAVCAGIGLSLEGIAVEWFLVWCLCAVIAGAIASSKGRSGAGWFFLGLFIGPFAFAVALLPSLEAQAQADARTYGQAGGYRKCPYCAEAIRVEAVKCRYCQSEVASVVSAHASGLPEVSSHPLVSLTPERLVEAQGYLVRVA